MTKRPVQKQTHRTAQTTCTPRRITNKSKKIFKLHCGLHAWCWVDARGNGF